MMEKLNQMVGKRLPPEKENELDAIISEMGVIVDRMAIELPEAYERRLKAEKNAAPRDPLSDMW